MLDRSIATVSERLLKERMDSEGLEKKEVNLLLNVVSVCLFVLLCTS